MGGTVMEELLSEILKTLKRLEDKMDMLCENRNESKKITMKEIREFITDLKNQAKNDKREFVVLTANERHNELKLAIKRQIVCNSMYQTMKDGDEILFKTESGHSSTLKIKYYLI